MEETATAPWSNTPYHTSVTPLSQASTLPYHGWKDHGPDDQHTPGVKDSAIDDDVPTPPKPEQKRSQHPLLRLWALINEVDPYMKSRDAKGLVPPDYSGTVNYMPPEIAAKTGIGNQKPLKREKNIDQYQATLNWTFQNIKLDHEKQAGLALRLWLNFKNLVRKMMVHDPNQSGRL